MSDCKTLVYPLQENTIVDVGATPSEVSVGCTTQTVESTTQSNVVSITVPDVTILSAGVQGPAGPLATEVIEHIHFVGSGTGATKTLTGIEGNVIYEGFGIDDELYMLWTLALDMDRTQDISLEGSFFPTASEAGTDTSWEIHITAHHHEGGGGETTGVIYANDLPLSDTAFQHSHGVAVIDAATYLIPTVDILHIKLKRVVSSNDPTATRVGVSDMSMRYYR